MKTVQVGPFRVIDGPSQDLPALLANRALTGDGVVAFALHVGGLNRYRDRVFVRQMNAADVTYADGAATVLIARTAGARDITRAATTDIGVPTIRELTLRLQRPVRVALVGGEPGLASRAGEALREATRCDVVFVADGYGQPLLHHAPQLREAAPDLLLVGLGMPLEAKAVINARDSLPPCLIMTCGGWFGFLAGEERRAPKLAQRFGLEWVWRLSHTPSRLIKRYSLGTAITMRLLLGAARTRTLKAWRR